MYCGFPCWPIDITDTDRESSRNLRILQLCGKRKENYGLWWMLCSCSLSGQRCMECICRREDFKESPIYIYFISSRIIISATNAHYILSSYPKTRKDISVYYLCSRKCIHSCRYRSGRWQGSNARAAERKMRLKFMVSKIAVQTQLIQMIYTGQNMSSYIDPFSSLFSQLERMGKDAAIPKTHKSPVRLASADLNSPL